MGRHLSMGGSGQGRLLCSKASEGKAGGGGAGCRQGHAFGGGDLLGARSVLSLQEKAAGAASGEV